MNFCIDIYFHWGGGERKEDKYLGVEFLGHLVNLCLTDCLWNWLYHLFSHDSFIFFSTTIIPMIIKLISKWKYKILDWFLCQSHPQIIFLTSPPIPKYILTICIANHSESYEDSNKNYVVLSIISMRLIHLIYFILKKIKWGCDYLH